ncbi:MAG: 8-amino-7-oxononanoate synthase [Gammaproteobacteria bacterium]|nr:8-amino-7-oxononanoate synthase [Gammaproteobacteria bacterium]
MIDFQKKLSSLKEKGLYRQRLLLDSAQDTIVTINKIKYINFASNNYLNLANNKKLKKSLSDNTSEFGIGSSSSPLISGYNKKHMQLEKKIAKLLRFESVLVVNSGYLANVGLINAIGDKDIIVFQDKLNHSSIIESSRLSSVKLIRYNHLDYHDLEKKLKKYKKSTKIIYTDTVFSMTGEIIDIKRLSKISEDNNALLFVDDAHGFGVAQNCNNDFPCSRNIKKFKGAKIDAYIGTFGKAIGTFGAFIAGSNELINLMVQKSRPYIYSTALPTALVATTIESINIIKSKPSLVNKLYENIKYFKKLVKFNNIKINESNTAIQTITIGDPITVVDICKKIKKENILIQAIRYPTVPINNDLIRVNLTSGHTKKQIQSLVQSLKKIIGAAI